MAVNRHRIWRKRLFRISPLCYFCGRKFEHWKTDATLEHLVPKVLGGTNAFANLALSCDGCNRKRGAWYMKHAWRVILEVRLRRVERELRAKAEVMASIRRALG